LRINPNGLVSVLKDGYFRLTESSAILKYIAGKNGSPAYPTELKVRARVNEMMNWFNASFYKNVGCGLVGANFSACPNIDRWMRNRKALKTRPQVQVQEAAEGVVATLKGKVFQTF